MATRRPIVLVSGVQAEMPRGDVIDTGLNVTLQPNPSGLYFTGDNKLGFDGQGDNIQVIASGVGAVYRTVQDKSRDIVNVKDFGAVGDGVTDDTAAIQDAINSVAVRPNGGEVFIPAGSYLVGLISLKDKVSISGCGNASKLVAKAGAFNVLDYNDASGAVPPLTYLYLRDFYIDASAQTGGQGIYITGLNDSEISGVTVYNAQGFGMLIHGAVRSKFLNNTIDTTRQWDGMTITSGSTGCIISGNLVRNSYDSGIGLTATIGNVVTGNCVIRQKVNGNWFAPGIDAAGAKNAVITGNYVIGNEYGISLLEHPNTGTQCKRVTVTGNTVADGQYGIICNSVAVIPPATPEITDRDGIVISGNTIFSQDVQGINAGGTTGLNISGNNIQNCATGIFLTSTARTSVMGNMLYLNNTALNTDGSSNSNLSVSFNAFENNSTAFTGGPGTGTPYFLHNKNLPSPYGTLNHEAFTGAWDFGGHLKVGGFEFWQNGSNLYLKDGTPSSITDGIPINYPATIDALKRPHITYQHVGGFAGGFTTVTDLALYGGFCKIKAVGREFNQSNASYGEWIAASDGTTFTLTLIAQSAHGNGHGTVQLQMSGTNLQVKNANSSSIGDYGIFIEYFDF